MSNVMEDTFKIHLRIADEDFYVTIKKDEEEESLYRNAAKRIDQIMDLYRKGFKDKDQVSKLNTKKLLAMTALHLAKGNIATERQSDDSLCQDVIKQLNRELEEFLK